MVTTVPVTHEAFLQPIVTDLKNQAWRVDGMAAHISGSSTCLDLYNTVIDVGWTRNPLDVAHLPGTVKIVREAVLSRGYDIVHVHTPVAAFLTRFALRRLPADRRPAIVYTAHGFHFSPELGALRNAVFAALERVAGRWTDRLVVINEDDHREALRRRIIAPERLVRMHGIGVDTDTITPDAIDAAQVARARTALGLAANDVLLLMVAEFTPNKRHRAVCDAFARTTHPSLRLAFAGTGALKAEIAGYAAGLSVADRIHFLGYRRDIPTLLATARATVLFSAREGLPRSSMESLAMERPVIGADIRGIRDLVAGGCGLLVPSGDVAALAETMDRIASDAGSAAEMGRRGREKMCGAYSTGAIVARHRELYDSLLG